MHSIYCLKICELISVLGMDCRLFPDSVHENAKCGDSNVTVYAKKSKGFSAHVSTCKSGYIGNGYSCMKKPNNCEDVCCNSDEKSLGIEETYCGCSNYQCLSTTITTTTFTTTTTIPTTTTTITYSESPTDSPTDSPMTPTTTTTTAACEDGHFNSPVCEGKQYYPNFWNLWNFLNLSYFIFSTPLVFFQIHKYVLFW